MMIDDDRYDERMQFSINLLIPVGLREVTDDVVPGAVDLYLMMMMMMMIIIEMMMMMMEQL